MSVVRYSVEGSTATVTLDSPHNRNAITQALLDGISEGLEQAGADEAVRSIVLTHTGNVFCAGADLRDSADASAPQERGRAANTVIRKLLTCPKPIIAAVHGHVRAGGMGFAAACDMVVAGPRASFGLSEVRIGVVAAMIAPVVLARLDDRTAADWLLRARTVSAEEAEDAGFITRAITAGQSGAGTAGQNTDTAGSDADTARADVDTARADADTVRADVDTAVEEILADLRRGAPKALAASKSIVNQRVLAEMDRREGEMIELSGQFFTGDDARAGMQAFFDKTNPPWVVGR